MKRQIEGYQPTDKLDTSNPPKCEENWINVKDKLPEIQKWVLIILESEDMLTSFYENNGWVFDHEPYSEVTHWMPLPEKPTK